MFDLKPEFEHITIPKMVASSFLKAKLTNESPYLILAGPSSVFVDNNFIAKVCRDRSDNTVLDLGMPITFTYFGLL